jgi:tRNA threonylcarbamoyladenosine biosynthesis protein TsaB
LIVLALETATRDGSLAVLAGDTLLGVRRGDAARPHATRLPADLLSMLAASGLTLAQVDLLAVCLGPGGFTGLRVGIAAIQGLALATGIPVAGVSALDALGAAGADALVGDESIVGVWMDGARREVFARRYSRDADALMGIAPLDEAVSAPAATVANDWRGAPPDVWIGDAVETSSAALDTGGRVLTPTPPIAPIIARLGARLAAKGQAGSPHALRPVYVRRSDAELARDRRHAHSGR